MRQIPAWSILVLLLTATATSADTYPRQRGVDAIHYIFNLTISDASNELVAESTVTVRFTAAGIQELTPDLTTATASPGMPRCRSASAPVVSSSWS